MDQGLPEWEAELLDEALRAAAPRRRRDGGRRRALQLAREQAYHRLAVAIDHPRPRGRGGQLSLFSRQPSLFDPPDPAA